MKHYGDITQLKGAEVPIVDIVTGGSPCQDLSVAGKRAGLDGERSGLFMEQIRLIKEMREHDRRTNGMETNEFIRPRWMVWENVAGAFSSNKGEDFRVVLEETAKIADENATIPGLKGGRWSHSGCIMGNGWSIAWRLHDAQFWGVPQRRKRIALVADFGGFTAPEILFERKSVSGDLEESGKAGEGASADVGTDAETTGGCLNSWDCQSKRIFEPDGVCATLNSGNHEGGNITPSVLDKCLNSWDVQSKHIQPENGKAEALYSGECRYGGGESYVMQGINGDKAETLDANYYKGCGERQGTERDVVCYGMSSYDSNAMKSPNPNSGIYEADTTRTLDNNGGNPACNQGGMIVLEGNGARESHKGPGYAKSDTMYTLNTVEQHAVCVGNGQLAQAKLSDKVGALNCMHDQQAVLTYGLDRASFNQGQNTQYNFSVEEDLAQTVLAKGPGGY